MASCFLMPKSYKVCTLPFCAISVVGCLLSIPAAAMFAELADPCTLKWWVELVRFDVQVSDMLQGALHHKILWDHGQDVFAKPSRANWVAWFNMLCHWAYVHLLLTMVQFSLTSPVFLAILLADNRGPGRACMLSVGLQPPMGPSWAHTISGFRRIGPVPDAYFRLPLSVRCMCRLSFRLSAQTLSM